MINNKVKLSKDRGAKESKEAKAAKERWAKETKQRFQLRHARQRQGGPKDR